MSSYKTIQDNLELDPFTNDKAMNDINIFHFQKFMKSEIESMYSNHVKKLVNLSEGVKPIESKWIYKRKRERERNRWKR